MIHTIEMEIQATGIGRSHRQTGIFSGVPGVILDRGGILICNVQTDREGDIFLVVEPIEGQEFGA
jgi:hypothetical protein